MTDSGTILEGIAWDHSRAYPPLVATAQRYSELYPDVTVRWHKRTLHEFGHADLADLAQRFDLIIMDHPWAGFAVPRNILVPLQDAFPPEYVADLESHSAGPSYASYMYEDQLLALPVDGATPAACRRPDLLATVPARWTDVMHLAREGRVIMPGFHVDVLLNFIGLFATLAEGRVFPGADSRHDRRAAFEALHLMNNLARHMPDEIWGWNPIRVYEELAKHEWWSYCPFAYTYSNYSRNGYCANPLVFHDTVTVPGCGRIRTVLGGTGIALSQRCRPREHALAYMAYVASGMIQSSLYVECGGQPAHRSAWEGGAGDRLARNFFSNTLPAMDRAVVRPREEGTIAFQEQAGLPLVHWLRHGGEPGHVLDEMMRIYRDNLGTAVPRQR